MKAAADDQGKEDAEAHHQPAPCWHGHVAGRHPPVMADIDRTSKERDKNADNGVSHGASLWRRSETTPTHVPCAGSNARTSATACRVAVPAQGFHAGFATSPLRC